MCVCEREKTRKRKREKKSEICGARLHLACFFKQEKKTKDIVATAGRGSRRETLFYIFSLKVGEEFYYYFFFEVHEPVSVCVCVCERERDDAVGRTCASTCVGGDFFCFNSLSLSLCLCSLCVAQEGKLNLHTHIYTPTLTRAPHTHTHIYRYPERRRKQKMANKWEQNAHFFLFFCLTIVHSNLYIQRNG